MVVVFLGWKLSNFFIYSNFFMQMSVAVKKILYAADAKESALPEAEEYLAQFSNFETKSDNEARKF